MAIVHRFTLGGVTDTTLGIQLAPGSDEPIAPRTRDRTVVIPGRAGAWDFGADMRERTFVLPCQFVNCTTQALLAAAIRTLADLLFDDDGEPEDLTLVFTKESTKTYTVRYSGKLPIARIVAGEVGTFKLPLTSFDPHAYAVESTDSKSITVNADYVDVTNGGNVKTPCEITITNNGVADIDWLRIVCRQSK